LLGSMTPPPAPSPVARNATARRLGGDFGPRDRVG
jgi:hypothetical protein